MEPSSIQTPSPTPTPSPMGFEPLESKPTRQHKPRKMIIVTGGIVVLLVAAGVCWYMFTPRPLACLTREDYHALSGEDLPDDTPFAPTVDAYGFDIEFSPNSERYTDETATTTLEALGSFVQKHPTTSVHISLSSISPDATAAGTALTEKRLGVIRSTLVKSGVATEVISTTTKTYDPDPYHDDAGTDNISLSVTSDETCRAD